MSITAKEVAELRERTGAAMMDCKKALEATGGDLELAIDHLRKSGLKSAEKRAGRSTAEGRVAAHVAREGRVGALVMLTSETDFVARTADFETLVSELAAHAAESRPGSPEEMAGQELASRGTTVGEAIGSLSGKLGENMRIARVSALENPAGRVGAYVHHNHKIGALVSVTSDAPPEKAEPFLKSLGMHVTAARPAALDRAGVPAEAVEREKAVYRESDELRSKPEERREKIVEGKLQKFFAQTVLLEQEWVLDPSITVAQALAQALGQGASIEDFALFQVGA